jgi:hypothetical protein
VTAPAKRSRTAAAVLVYVVVLVALQIFLVTVAVEAFLTDDESIAWATAAVSAVLFALAAAFLRFLRS